MSATLGETMRARLEKRPRVDVAAAISRAYPVVSAQHLAVHVPAGVRRDTEVRIEPHPVAVDRALGACRRGEAVLWLRSTVADAVGDHRTFQALDVDTVLHHSRFADEDRQFLDRQVLQALGPNGQRRGVVVVATQTCEQSLDIDADVLVTDAVPADVLLQRLGRLHRHRTGTVPTAVVLEPGEWNRYVDESGKAVAGPGRGWAWVYNPLAVRETIEWLRLRQRVSVPDDVREMVELATHADHLRARAQAYGRSWLALWQRLYVRADSDRQQALAVLVDRSQGYDRALVDGRSPTRLGDGTVDVTVEGELLSPFTSVPIRLLPVRARWLAEVTPGVPATLQGEDAQGRSLLDVGGVELVYG